VFDLIFTLPSDPELIKPKSVKNNRTPMKIKEINTPKIVANVYFKKDFIDVILNN
jgi:hypothetical protein